MCCIFTTLVVLGPRVGMFVWWLIQPLRFRLVYNTFIWPLLGIVFVPWTTLTYTLVWRPAGPMFWGWLLLAVALVADIGSLAGGAFSNRDRIPGRR